MTLYWAGLKTTNRTENFFPILGKLLPTLSCASSSRILFPFSTVETGDFSGDSASAADSAGTSPPAPLLAFEGEGLGGSAVDL